MTHRDFAVLVSPDLNLSPAARVLVLHVAAHDREGEGVEIAYADLHRLLGIKDLRALRREIGAAAGFVEVQTQTGRGHHPRFFYRGAESTLLNADRGVQSAPLSVPSSTTTTTPPTPTTAGARVRVPAGMDDPMLPRLRAALGDHGHAVDLFAASAAHPANWATQVWAFYRPPGTDGENDGGGTQARTLAGLNGRWWEVVASAMMDFAATGKPYSGAYFRTWVERAARDERKQRDGGGAGAGDHASGGHTRRPAGKGQAQRGDALADAADRVS